ncbi:uncharacterized [Tachysurus ichikawai]
MAGISPKVCCSQSQRGSPMPLIKLLPSKRIQFQPLRPSLSEHGYRGWTRVPVRQGIHEDCDCTAPEVIAVLHRWTLQDLMHCGVRLAAVQEPLNEAEPSSLCLTSLFILHRSAAEHLSSLEKCTCTRAAPADPL